MPSLLAPVMVLAPARQTPPAPDAWASWRWLGTADERVLWAILAATLLLFAWGVWTGYRRDR